MKIKAFGISREIVGSDSLELDPGSEKIRLGELRERLLKEFPELGKIKPLAIAVNMEKAGDDTEVGEGDELALIPPVSGG